MKKGTIIISLIFLLLNAGYVYMAIQLPASPAFGDVGPAELPFWLGIAGILLSLALIISELRKKPDAENGSALRPSVQGISYILLVILFAIGVNLIGFLATTFVFSLLGVMLLERRLSLLKSGIMAVGTTLFIYLVFILLLDVPLPEGVLWG